MFKPTCPVVAAEQAWIDENMEWFRVQFGDRWLSRPVVLPTDDYFPGVFTGSPDEVRAAVASVCSYMGVDVDRIVVEFHETGRDDALARAIGAASSWSGAAGHYRTVDGKAVVSLEESLAGSPRLLVATIAHELAHARLLGEGRVAHDRPDQEPLTDLLTVYLGVGLFAANASLEFASTAGRWSASRLGYLTEPMFGYALARYAWMRGETDPAWGRFLDTNPRTFLKKGLRYLKHSAG
ncbi:hypothetical protein ODJ79_03200 [Actinoplanes sp. KI2]|uniref:hypothetical protein n=1 Tax=Actinoplanes sp. KI2 TaxID=2983315 RepID=UPI0021D5DCC9|nr:hypothetical protein [Actinoplanes sp. KI2]MCU7722713.1 hypothetical protein [Actinoplanes sp. KI2]